MAHITTPASLTDRSSEETRSFYQERIVRYLLIYGALGASFLVLRLVGALQSPQGIAYEVGQQNFWAHAGGVIFSFAGWILVRRGNPSVDHLETVETGALLASMVCYELMGYFMPVIASPELVVMLALALGLFARAIYVPSTARRSLLLALAVAVPHVAIVANAPFREHDNPLDARATVEFLELAAEIYQPGVAVDLTQMAFFSALNVALWWAGTIALTTGASRVIYNLRAEVRDHKRLGQYHLEEKLGEGGMGTVHRASHAMLQRPTAVKLLPADQVGERSLARFEREVKQTARLTHPNTITIFDYGRTPEGVFYYAMELIEGPTLEQVVVDEGIMPPGRVVHLLIQVCGSLAEAHGVGLIHRDIKPANIMICERGGVPDRIKVLDFGLVKELTTSDAVSLTQADVVTGTPQYMPPEALTKPDEVDGRSDLYSLGAVAFFLMTGRLVFEGRTMVEICSHHLHTAPPRPSELADEPVPADLEDVVMACLAKDPADRPQTARDLAKRLAACDCAGSWTVEDAGRWWAGRA